MAVGVGREVRGVGAAVRRHRLALGMDVAQLAEEVGVRPSELGRWERGDAVPPPTRIRALARALRVDQATMLTWIADGEKVVDSLMDTDGAAVDIVIDLAPPDPFVTLIPRSAERKDPVRLPAPATRVARPRPVASVFPAPTRSLDDDRHVYSPTAGFPHEAHPRLHSTGRTVRTAIALVALGVALVWAFHQLGHGVSDLLDLFGGPTTAPGG
ncbi:MAG: helix-turn-helix transcriptional regulator [Acidimicrobiia bacterium]|nr:helix-turn-helix transcriptional regulator [Acidimicrobiia bacterium]